MDGINLLNATRVKATCRSDGMVLKPDRPATTTDACFLSGDPKCTVYHTYSDVQGLGRAHYYYNNDDKAMTAAEVYLTASKNYIVRDWYSGKVSYLADSNSVAAGYEGHVYAVVSPVVGGWTLLGEVDKYVPLSSTRFTSVTVGR